MFKSVTLNWLEIFKYLNQWPGCTSNMYFLTWGDLHTQTHRYPHFSFWSCKHFNVDLLPWWHRTRSITRHHSEHTINWLTDYYTCYPKSQLHNFTTNNFYFCFKSDQIQTSTFFDSSCSKCATARQQRQNVIMVRVTYVCNMRVNLNQGQIELTSRQPIIFVSHLM